MKAGEEFRVERSDYAKYRDLDVRGGRHLAVESEGRGQGDEAGKVGGAGLWGPGMPGKELG